ncbi:hypothetical protein [Pseudomonas entomophila]|uniref:hypothetical protein n=1 Tax=Pseudomonas entomophila TaxID=312306 RepID=UPI003D6631A0
MHTKSDWQQRAARQRFITTALIDGRPVAAIDPATNQCVADVAACSDSELDKYTQLKITWIELR